MFVRRVTIKMHHIDAAGVMFFAWFFHLAHDAYETFLADVGFSIEHILQQDFLIPIVHTEADYQAPVKLGDELTIELVVERIGDSSFTLAYDMLNQQHQRVATVKTVHVTIGKSTRKRMAIPQALRESLEDFCRRD